MKTILCVDDDEHLLELVSFTLEGPEYRVLVARNGAEALALMELEDLDVLVLDWMMPGIAGIDVARRVAKPDEAPAIVMLTSMAQAKDIAEARAAGVQHYLTKPFSPLELLATVHEAAKP